MQLSSPSSSRRQPPSMAYYLPSHLHFADVAISLLVTALTAPLLLALHGLLLRWRRARRARRIFEAQGVKCLPRPFFFGNMLEFAAIASKARSQPMPELSAYIAPRILPHLYQWSKIYGEHFVYWFGFQARYILRDPEQARELLSTKSGHFRKVRTRPDARDLVGNGLGSLHGEKWAQHRRILSPAFYTDKLKAMAPVMVSLTTEMLKRWEPRVESSKAIDVFEEFRTVTADIIAHTAFGSSFTEGKLVFDLQRKQQEIVAKLALTPYIPGSRFLPTSWNRYRKSLKRKINERLGAIIQKRILLGEEARENSYGSDLLGLMLAANKGELNGTQKNLTMGLDELIDECKTFFFAGHETTATLLTFMFLLLATHLEWQERLREEVYETCGKTQLPAADSLNNLRLLTMVIHESLRLYPPGVAVLRQADRDIRLGQILVPAGTAVVAPIIAWHQDERYWGPDAKEFHPERFEDGPLKACKVPGAYLPFSIGPRNCIGQMFANIEAKMVTATILQKYRFRLSPEYRHAPTITISIRPGYGLPIIFEKVE